MVAAFPLILISPALAAAMLPPMALYAFAVVPAEEAVMRRRHPREYRDYCLSVARWLPSLARYDHGAGLNSASFGFRREGMRMLWWTAFAAAAQLLASA